MKEITYNQGVMVQMNFSHLNHGPPERSDYFGPFETREAAIKWAEQFIAHERFARGFWTHPMWTPTERDVPEKELGRDG